MNFTLFEEISFKINNPLTLIEACCIQNNFYRNYDINENRTIKDANMLGARGFPIKVANAIVNKYINLELLKLNIDDLLIKPDNDKNRRIADFSKAIAELIKVKGIGLSKATKIYHTLYPKIIPVIDNPLKEEYMNVKGITQDKLSLKELFTDYYKTFDNNKENIEKLYRQLSSHRLTKVRIFDIIWWSFLKYKRLAADFPEIQWSTIESM